MDSLITAAALALAAGDPLGALKRIALREDAPALALRGIAMAQLGEFARAKTLLRAAGRAFGPAEAVARARCVVAEAEIALASRDLTWPAKSLETARSVLERHGDRTNAAYARLLAIRRVVLMGRLDEAEVILNRIDAAPLPPAMRAQHELVVAGIALRRLRASAARDALARAAAGAHQAGITALIAETETALRTLQAPAARLMAGGGERVLRLDEVEALLASDTLVVDACRRAACLGSTVIPLARRPILFALLRRLAEACPGDVPRTLLVRSAFRIQQADDSLRSRLRVEVGRLRKTLAGLAEVNATERGFALKPRSGREVVVLAPPVENADTAVLALLADGEAWSSSALALALATSQRTVQRTLDTLAAANKARAFGQGRARRWMAAPLPGFATTLLLPPPLPNG